MKRLSLALLTTVIASTASAAEGPKVTLGGKINTQAGYRHQKDQFEHIDSDVSKGKLHNFAIVNSTRVKLKADGKAGNGLKYGAHIEIYADASSNSDGRPSLIGDKVWSYVESAKHGRVEAGSVKSAAHQMHINAGSIARATGGIDGDSMDWIAKKTADNLSKGDRFILTPGLPSFCDCKSAANKVNYFTPKYNGVQFGISYTPDVKFFGTASQTHSITRSTGDQYKEITALAATYEKGINKDLSFAIAATGEIGRSKGASADRNNLKAYELGGKVVYKNFALAGSYSDWLSSGEPVNKSTAASYGANHWTIGGEYSQDIWGISVTYLQSKRANSYSSGVPATTATHDNSHNKLREVSIGFDITPMPGFMPYVEYTYFEFERAATLANNTGGVLLAGTKITF